MAQERIYVEYSEEVRQALKKHDVDMVELVRAELAKGQIQGEVKLASDPTKPDDEVRDVFLLIIAGGIAVSMVAAAVARVIDAVTKRKATGGEVKTLEVALDGKGNVVRDASGEPVYNVSTKPAGIPESKAEKTTVEIAKLVKFEYQR